ncbi:MFS transporter [Dictyobacter aurantiacus]|uniref:MFS transporter n=1 Tax=Dictyobacter aurantiacus TaxID=1936993 RepID=A0A401ZMB5_9CHLR|nr:MFS transporter [Dictyobacter aurantiacus]GCE07970.1 MFS transporter [Dictyobacter aurantiacus]
MTYETIRTNQTLLFFACCFTFIANGLLGVLPAASLVVLAQNTHTETSTAGLIFTVSSSGTIVAVVVSNALIKRLGSKAVVIAGLAGLIASSIMIPLAQQFNVWLAAEMLQGMSIGLINIGVIMTLTLNFGDRLGEKLNMLHGSVGMGSLLAPIFLSYALSFTGSALAAFIVTALVGLLCLSTFYVLRFQTRAARRNISHAVYEAPQPSLMPDRPGPAFKQSLLWLIALQVCLYVGAEAGFSNWVITAISKEANISVQMTTPAATLFWIGITSGRMAVARFMKRGHLTNAQLLYISMLGGAACGVLLIACMQVPIVCFVASFGVGLFLGPIFPTLQAIATRRFDRVPALVSSVVMVSSGFAGMTIPLSMGMLIPQIGAREVMMIPALLCLLVAFPYYLANRKEQKIVAYRQQQTERPIYELPTIQLPIVESVA